jgi:phosphoglucomutase
MSADLNVMKCIRRPIGQTTGQRWVKLYNAARRAFYISHSLNRRRAKRAANVMAQESRKMRAQYGTTTPGGVPIVPVHGVKRVFIRLLTNPANYG